MEKHLAKLLSFILIMALLTSSAAFAENLPDVSDPSVIDDGDEIITASAVDENVIESEQSLDDADLCDNGLGVEGIADFRTSDADTSDIIVITEEQIDDESVIVTMENTEDAETYQSSGDDSSDHSDGKMSDSDQSDGNMSDSDQPDSVSNFSTDTSGSGDDGIGIIASVEGDTTTVSIEASDIQLDGILSDNGLSQEADNGLSLDSEGDSLFSGFETDVAPEMQTLLVEDQAYTSNRNIDNTEMLDAYIQQLFDASLGNYDPLLFSAQYTAGNQLESVNRAVYEILAEAIADIADGKTSNTEITITATELYNMDNSIICGPWSVADLGPDNKYAFQLLGLSLSDVLNALQADYPYELYWYEKTLMTYSSMALYGNSEYGYSMDSMTISMPVSEDYATAAYTVDSSAVVDAQTAIANAQAIVANSSGSVSKRLATYKNTICELVTYNDHAAKEENNVPYGDPWQLVYVFDGNNTTNVVCEGYSKAFKYLFDLSNFGDSYDCILVTGDMDSGEGAGGHMWNLVRMEDGNNYLVDVTNCDEGTIGSPDKLFMAYNPSGSWNNYSFILDQLNSISYTYDEKTLATFTKDQLTISPTSYDTALCTITAVASPSSAGCVTGGEEYTSGSEISVFATPAEGYMFVNWLENGAVVSTDASYTFIVTDDRILTATFVLADPENTIFISEEYFEDDAFRAFLSQQYGTQYINGHDVKDDLLTPNEIASITELDVSGKGISSLDGIEHFTALSILDCTNNNLTELDLTKCATLTNLSCSSNKLTKLNVNGLQKLAHLNCQNNLLETINMSDCPLLETPMVGKNSSLITVTAKNCTNMATLSIEDSSLSTLDVSGCTSMISLFCRNNQLTSLNIDGCASLKELYCYNNLLPELDVSCVPTLVELVAFDNLLETVTLTGCSNLKVLYTNGNNVLASLDISDCPKLCEIVKEKYFSSIPDGAVLYSKNDNWQLMYDEGTELIMPVPSPSPAGIAITETNFPDEIFRTYITNNFDKYDESGNEVVANGYLSDYEIGRVSSINLYGDFDWNSNTFSGLGITSLEGIDFFTSLVILQCGYNQLGSLDVSGMTQLQYLDCCHCSLESLNVGGCTSLNSLICYGNSLDTLDISTCSSLLPCCISENRKVNYERNDRDAYIAYESSDNYKEFAFDYGTTVNPLTNTEAAGIPINPQNFPDEQFRNYISANFDKYNSKGKPGADRELSEREIMEARYMRLDDQINGNWVGMGISTLEGIKFFIALESLECSYNQLGTLDVSGLNRLEDLYCRYCGLESLNVNECTSLKAFNCPYNNLNSLDISDCPNLVNVYTTRAVMDYSGEPGEDHYAGYFLSTSNTGFWLDYGVNVITVKSAPQPDTYKIKLELNDHGEIPADKAEEYPGNVKSFTIDTEAFELPKLNDVTEGDKVYTFSGWTLADGTDKTAYTDVTIDPAAAIATLTEGGDTIIYTAQWTEVTIGGKVNYSIPADGESSILGLADTGDDGKPTCLNEMLKQIAANNSTSVKDNENIPADAEITMVTVDMVISTTNDTEKDGIIEIIGEPESENVDVKNDFIDIAITQTTSYATTAGEGKEEKHIHVLPSVVEIPLKYDLTGHYNLRLFRKHNSIIKELNPLTSRPKSSKEMVDGTFFISGQGNSAVVYIYSSLFSTFAFSSENRESFNVVFNSNGGSTVPTQKVYQGEKVKKPDTPTRAATATVEYVFDKWCSDETLKTAYDFTKAVTEGFTLHACWIEKIIEKKDSSSTVTNQSNPAPTVVSTPTTPSTPTESITISKTPASVKAKAAKKGKVTVSWKKIKKTKKTKALLAQIKSIEVQYSTDPGFTTDVVTKPVSKNKTKVTLKLQKNTTYYVRVRYTDGAGGVSAWSATKRVKTKK